MLYHDQMNMLAGHLKQAYPKKLSSSTLSLEDSSHNWGAATDSPTLCKVQDHGSTPVPETHHV